MIASLAVAVFALVGGLTIGLLLRLTSPRAVALERLAPGARPPEAAPAKKLTAWKALASRVAASVPSRPGDSVEVRRRLVLAGIRTPGAVRIFQGIRALAAACGALLALAWGLHTASQNVFLLVGAGAAAGYIAPMQFVLQRMRKRRRAIEKALPNVLDLLVVCVESGLGLDQAIMQVARELRVSYPDICDELALMNLELRAGKGRPEALHNLADRTGVDDLRKLVTVIVQADRFGTSIAHSLRGHSEYMRTMARQRAEEQAAKLAVKLVFPIFFCVLPSLFVVTIGPVMTRLVRDLIPMIEKM